VSTGTAPGIDDQLWSALGDPTRRRLLDLLLTAGEGTATTLGNQLPLTRQAVAKQLSVLARAGLVHSATVGREKRYRVNDARLARAVAQLSSVGAAWDARLHDARLHRIKQIAETLRQS
jgi:predicted transcriptional regulator